MLPENRTFLTFCVNTITKDNVDEQRLITLEHYIDEPLILDAKGIHAFLLSFLVGPGS